MKVIVYGIGKRYFDLFDYKETADIGIMKHDIEIVGFSDSNPTTFGKKIMYNGRLFEVKSIRDYSKTDFEKIMVTTNDYFKEIKDGLIKMGYMPDQIFPADDILESNHGLIWYENFSLLSKKWAKVYEELDDITLFFNAGGYKNIAVYGNGMEAEILAHKLEQSGIEIRYFIAAVATKKFGHIPVFKIESKLPQVDIIVVTDNDNYLEIEREICEKNPIEVISVQELIYKTLKNEKIGMTVCGI